MHRCDTHLPTCCGWRLSWKQNPPLPGCRWPHSGTCAHTHGQPLIKKPEFACCRCSWLSKAARPDNLVYCCWPLRENAYQKSSLLLDSVLFENQTPLCPEHLGFPSDQLLTSLTHTHHAGMTHSAEKISLGTLQRRQETCQ